MKKQILILGGGFAGIGAAQGLRDLASESNGIDVTLFDRHPYTTMIPSLPDLAGTRIDADYLTEDIKRLVHPSINVIAETVQKVDMKERVVETNSERHTYDHLVIATGSITNLFGFNQHLEHVHTLDCLEDGRRISEEFPDYLRQTEEARAVVVGGGYTGLELACNLRYCAEKQTRDCDIPVIEVKDSILPGMPVTIRGYLEQRCVERRLHLLTGLSVQAFDGRTVELSDGSRMENVFLCWSTGTKFGLPIAGDHDTIRDGRIVVDEFLRVPPHPEVFVAGDAAAMSDRNGNHLRKAVNFSVYSGRCAGKNVRRVAQGDTPRSFTPKDLGWVIPFCNTATGKLFSKVTVRGRFPLALHYFMCGYRNYNTTNRLHFLNLMLRALTCKH